MQFDVVRVCDGVVLATYDNFDAAYSYAQVVVNVMRVHGECSVVTREALEVL